MAKSEKTLTPLEHHKSTHAELASSVELAGWGNNEAAALPIRVVGDLIVDTHSCGMLHFTCVTPCATQDFFALRFHGNTPHAFQPGQRMIPEGSRFYAHPTHVRAITMAPREVSDAKKSDQ